VLFFLIIFKEMIENALFYKKNAQKFGHVKKK